MKEPSESDEMWTLQLEDVSIGNHSDRTLLRIVNGSGGADTAAFGFELCNGPALSDIVPLDRKPGCDPGSRR